MDDHSATAVRDAVQDRTHPRTPAGTPGSSTKLYGREHSAARRCFAQSHAGDCQTVRYPTFVSQTGARPSGDIAQRRAFESESLVMRKPFDAGARPGFAVSGSMCRASSGERPREEPVDRAPAAVTERPGTGAREMGMVDARRRRTTARGPRRTAPLEPVIAVLIEHP